MNFIVNELADDFAIESWVAISYYSNIHDFGDYSFAIYYDNTVIREYLLGIVYTYHI